MGTKDKAVTAEERVRLYLKLVDSPSLAGDIVYDKRFKTEAWPRTAYALERDNLVEVLAQLDLYRDKCRELESEHDDPALGWVTAGIEAAMYERERQILEFVYRAAKGTPTEKVFDAAYATVPDPLENPKRPELVEELCKALEELAVQRQDIEDLTNERDDLKAEVEYLRGTTGVYVEKAVELVRCRLALFLHDGTRLGEEAARSTALDLLRGLPGIPESEGPNG